MEISDDRKRLGFKKIEKITSEFDIFKVSKRKSKVVGVVKVM